MLDQYAKTLQLLAGGIAARAGREPGDFTVRTVAGVVLGIVMAVLAGMADNPEAELPALIDAGFASLESGLRL